MHRDLPALEGDEFDLVVVGGGMFGAAAALDAAQRGLRDGLDRARGLRRRHLVALVQDGAWRDPVSAACRHSAAAPLGSRPVSLPAQCAASRPPIADRGADLRHGDEEQARAAGRHGGLRPAHGGSQSRHRRPLAPDPSRDRHERRGDPPALSGPGDEGPHGCWHLLRRPDVQPAPARAGLCAERRGSGRSLRQLCRGYGPDRAGGPGAWRAGARCGHRLTAGDPRPVRPERGRTLRRVDPGQQPRPRLVPADTLLARCLLHRPPAADRGRPRADGAGDQHRPRRHRQPRRPPSVPGALAGLYPGRRLAQGLSRASGRLRDHRGGAQGLDRRGQRRLWRPRPEPRRRRAGQCRPRALRRERPRCHGAEVRASLAHRRPSGRARPGRAPDA